MPESVETPAPVKTTIRRAPASLAAAAATRSPVRSMVPSISSGYRYNSPDEDPSWRQRGSDPRCARLHRLAGPASGGPACIDDLIDHSPAERPHPPLRDVDPPGSTAA